MYFEKGRTQACVRAWRQSDSYVWHVTGGRWEQVPFESVCVIQNNLLMFGSTSVYNLSDWW